MKVDPKKLSPNQNLLDPEDFQAALKKDRRDPVHVEVTYLDMRVIVYKPEHFKNIRYPVFKMVIQYPKGSGKFISNGQGDGYNMDRRIVKSVKPSRPTKK